MEKFASRSPGLAAVVSGSALGSSSGVGLVLTAISGAGEGSLVLAA